MKDPVYNHPYSLSLSISLLISERVLAANEHVRHEKLPLTHCYYVSIPNRMWLVYI